MGEKIRRLEGAGADDRSLANLALTSLRRCFTGFQLVRVFWCAPGVLGVVYSLPPRRLRHLLPREVRFELFFDDRWEVRPQYQLQTVLNAHTGVGVAGVSNNCNIRSEANLRLYASELLRWSGKGPAYWFESLVGDFEVGSDVALLDEADVFLCRAEIDERPSYDN